MWKNGSRYQLLDPEENRNLTNSNTFNYGRNKWCQPSLVFLGSVVVCCIVLFSLFSMGHRSEVRETLQASAPSSENPTIEISTKNGKVVGIELKSRGERNYHAFLKIPYAQPPVNDLRFKLPILHGPWNGTLNGTAIASQCTQTNEKSAEKEVVGEEDCLYLNIYTPKIPERNNETVKLPVMVYIHGGGFDTGNGSRYGADYFMDEDVILITFGFRLGPFGFLNSEDGELSGNIGFKDQVCALKWVQKNIDDYFGDPTRVLIFGNSAGAIGVTAHLVSPLSSGLFTRAILESGTCLNSIVHNPRKTVEELANSLNCNMSSQVSECLRGKTPIELLNVTGRNVEYGLTYENGSWSDEEIFMPGHPLILFQNGEFNNVSVIAGVNSEEGLHQSLSILNSTMLTTLADRFFNVITPLILGINTTVVPRSTFDEMKTLYFNESAIGNETWRNLTDLFSDQSMIHPTFLTARLQATKSPVYLYYLTKMPAKSYAERAKEMFPGEKFVAHADELQYLFLYNGYPEIPTDSPYFNFSRSLVQMWSNFAANGVPGEKWETINLEKNTTVWNILDDVFEAKELFTERMAFWDSIPQTELYDLEEI